MGKVMNAKERSLFEIPQGHARDRVYLNTANIGPRLKAVSEAGHKAIERFATPWQLGDDDWFGAPERLRELFGRFINADTDSLSFVPSASYGIAIAAKNLPLSRGQTIVVVEEQYPSNVYAWRRRASEARAVLRVAERSPEHSLTESVLRLIDADTAIVAIPNCHWTDGELIDLAQVAEATRSASAALVVDASQSLGAWSLDIAGLQPDFVVSVGYKWLLGPYGFGYLYSSERWQREGVPLEESWLARAGSEDFSQLVAYVDEYRPGARRFDFGEYPQFISVAMATAALSQMNVWGADYIRKELALRGAKIRTMCDDLNLQLWPAERSVPHIVGIRLADGAQAKTMGEHFRSAGIHISVRGRTIRVAPHLHTDDEDLERFATALKKGKTRLSG